MAVIISLGQNAQTAFHRSEGNSKDIANETLQISYPNVQ
jgi:hypothetical protein